MKTLVTCCAIGAALWWLFCWGLMAVLLLVGAVLPDNGSIIGFKTPGWFVAVVWLIGPLVLGLHWASVRSLRGTIALACMTLALLASGLAHPAFWGMAFFLGPTLLLLPLLWYWHTRAKPGV